MKKIRLDAYLYNNNFYDSREKAKKSILAGDVLLNDFPETKPGKQIDENYPVEKVKIKKPLYPYVSRGGLKLEKGIKVFDFPVENRRFLDIGASTGGFTDCLLQNGATHVYSIDVGYGQLDYQLRQNDHVTVLERTNFRYLEPESISEKVDGSVMDVSFISILKLIDNIKNFEKDGALNVWLIKPQFEAGKEKVGKNGVVSDPKVHKEVLENVLKQIQEKGFSILGLDISPIKGPSGNKEFLVFTKNEIPKIVLDFSEDIRKLI